MKSFLESEIGILLRFLISVDFFHMPTLSIFDGDRNTGAAPEFLLELLIINGPSGPLYYHFFQTTFTSRPIRVALVSVTTQPR